MPLIQESPALKTTSANSGVIELCINIGTITGDSIAHLVEAIGTKNVDKATIKNVMTTRASPDNCIPLSNSDKDATTNKPILVYLNIIQNCEAKNISTNKEATSFK